MNPSQSLPLSQRLSMTLEGLARAVAACSDRRRIGGALASWLIVLIWGRIKKAEGRIQLLLQRFREGRLGVAAPVRAERGTGRRGGRRAGGLKGVPLHFAWLLPLVPCEAANFASQLRVLLAEPEMAGLLAVSAQARRVLAPLCRMLGIEKALLTPGPGLTAEVPIGADGGARDGSHGDGVLAGTVWQWGLALPRTARSPPG